MATFLSDDFLLNTETARRLYHSYAAKMPIIDYHCHVSPKEIYENKQFRNITEIWLGGDHYKWRLMRSHGIDERYITGDADDYEKFEKFAEALPYAIGNPMYTWCHLELKRYFGFEGVLSPKTCRTVWELCEKKLTSGKFGARDIIRMSGVTFIGTTDDPIDDLGYHKRIREDQSFSVTVAPSFRPDKALNIDKAGFGDYLRLLGETVGFAIVTVSDIKRALSLRMRYFADNGCRASDHGLDRMVYLDPETFDLDAILQKALLGTAVSEAEAEAFKTELLLYCAKEYASLGWVMQLHYNCMRNPNSTMMAKLGPDTGFDCIGPNASAYKVAKLLDRLYREDCLPKTVLYSLDASDNAFLDTVIGAFQGAGVRGKLQHGSAWWFNDNKQGMKEQMISLANLSILGNFVGMLTDSRSFLSYTRHEYFRRILCALIGEWVENGEYPNDEAMLFELVAGISYENAKRYFGL
ncbi:MAG: glucuronate isomerase [Clostridia bacterium]|nr:glucuronate isomerase [Clostridia bacterium]